MLRSRLISCGGDSQKFIDDATGTIYIVQESRIVTCYNKHPNKKINRKKKEPLRKRRQKKIYDRNCYGCG